jgi:hypothetical protein
VEHHSVLGIVDDVRAVAAATHAPLRLAISTLMAQKRRVFTPFLAFKWGSFALKNQFVFAILKS